MKALKRILSSYTTMIVLLAVYAAGLAIATFIEKAYSTMLAKVLVYYSPVFFMLQLLLVVNFILIFIRCRFYKPDKGRWGLVAIHFSFIIILLGALVSHITGKEGVLHLREGEKSNAFTAQTNHGTYTHTLPFEIELTKFTLKRYPGSRSPSSYESNLLIYVDGEMRRESVYMNNVLDVKGYRFFQASYDQDERGTVLSVNRDVAGRSVTYTGYVLLLAGGILCLTTKNGRIRTLYRQLKQREIPYGLFGILLLISSSAVAATNEFPNNMSETMQYLHIAPEHAKDFGSLPVQTITGRIVPVNTFSSEVMRKLYRDTGLKRMNPDQFLLSVLAYPEMWMYVQLIDVPDKNFALYFGLTHGHCTFMELFESNGVYKLQEKLGEAYRKRPDKRTAFDKELIKFDERINIFSQLINKQLIRLFPKPDDPSQKWYAPGDDLSDFMKEDYTFITKAFADYITEVRAAVRSKNWDKANEALKLIRDWQYENNNIPEMTADRIALELRYNRMEIFRWCKIGYLSLGGLLLLFSFISVFREKRRIKWIIRVLGIIVLIVFHYQMMGMGMRWKIGGYAPWSNSYETMVYAAWATVFAGLMFVRRSPLTFALSTLFAGVILFVSSLSRMDPQINPLVPVLKSPWLMFHVAMIMSAYGFFGISFLLGMTNLTVMRIARKRKRPGDHSLLKRTGSFPNLNDASAGNINPYMNDADPSSDYYYASIRELSVINEISLNIGLILMMIGTFMGAVWANESWGRYWGWDPKETWALITVIVYVMLTHLHLLKTRNGLWIFNFCSVIAFASVLMTYFGVNYFLSGMHSYG
ncbi:MAG: cytochrome c biogenesis protein CcsA [Tannerella sp.]|jgi:cytochrome c-type biogenesis protein CcsB|nr:cytochrome c biogenesis protein CcsA [Tannerella sp.]